MKPGVPELRQIKRFARGAGIDVKRSPDLGMPRELGAKAHEHVGARVLPKRC